MIRILAVSSLFFAILSWFLNLLLLTFLIFRTSTQYSGYRLISLAIVIFDLLFSAAYAITVPLWHADGNGLMLLIPVGYTSTLSMNSFLGSLVRPSYIIWHGCMIATSFLVSATFVYRYAVICKYSAVATTNKIESLQLDTSKKSTIIRKGFVVQYLLSAQASHSRKEFY
ncbi:hypothetical protein PMAYCL1PPCAC_13052 [Pristionchus mayeri]|uniref:G protein-coupled receptor n=1 Tax=Pristionchus mayeri TaxID=1317129 RepID=A0AAN5CG45_9BILA|nr:hypothetical protein PMAYCL1PPCAC_13052 [Pristionchus mayeri]